MAGDGINWSNKQLKEAGLKRAKVASIVRRLRKISAEMSELGLQIYGSDGNGNLIHESRLDHDSDGNADYDAVIASVGFGFDGGGW